MSEPIVFITLVLCPFACYGVAWISATAYFKAKMAYQQRLIRELNHKGD